jgi:hypothetical protein
MMETHESEKALRITKAALRAMLFTTVLTGAACSAERADSAGGSMEPPRLTAVEDLRIGSIDDPDQALTRVLWGLLPMPDGRLWVHQVDDRQFRIYSAEGALVGVAGREGEGPGEFTGMREFGWWGDSRDTVWVVDLNRRVSLFNADGEFTRSFSWPRIEHLSGYFAERPLALLTDGTALGRAADRELTDFRIIRYDLAREEVLTEVARLERYDFVSNPPFMGGSAPVLMPDNELVAFSSNGEWLAIVDRRADGLPDMGRVPVHALSADGDTLWSRLYSYEPLPIPQAERDSIVNGKVVGLQEALAQRNAAVSREEIRDGVIETFTLPGHRPPVLRTMIDQDDRLWLEWAAAPGAVPRWSLHDRNGDLSAWVEVPRRVQIWAATGNFFWSVETDELDVPYVVRYLMN